ncbi:MAG: nucleoside phosphorylase [Candidatus Bathyarchaeota archaeon]|nr:nucleoside phosphorylase [Candidatus Bathyarchaeota archaeon A05DMB-5]MDH7557238.1 nucleoside phosphorylase [Candidatus Bathyarchaeota archaeon]
MHSTPFGVKQYHIACKKGDLTKCLLAPGDPDRVPRIARFWDSAHEVSCHREFRSFTGKYKGVPISAMSSGIGPACMSILANEASRVGVETFIRVGSTGAIQKHIECGDVIISSAAVRLDCTSNCYIMPEYPAVANYEVLLALIEAAECLGISNYHVGVTATTADFYAGQDRPTKTAKNGSLLLALQKAGVLNFEMETATLYTLASLLGLRAGSICAVYANRCTNEFKPQAGEETAIKIANEAVKILNEWDKTKHKRKKQWFFPSLLSE